jgi:hypothetical protein
MGGGMDSQAQSTKTEIPESVESFTITTQIKVRHLFDGDYYNRTEVYAEIHGEAVVAGRRIVFPYRKVIRSQDLTYGIGDFVKHVLDDIKLQQELMLEDIANYAKNRKILLEELSKVGEVVEEYAQNYDDESEDDSDP